MSFLALFVSLPTKASTGRMRVWRSVKAQGCATLRDGVYYYLAESLIERGARADKEREAEALPYFERLLAEFKESEFLLEARKRVEELKAQ